jgi:hypothetical protein
MRREPRILSVSRSQPARASLKTHFLRTCTAWYQDYAAGASPKTGGPGPGVAGRSFYSSLGHNNSTWMDPTFMKHVMGGLTWTFGSNTTRVAQGLYNGAQPTVHTGSSNNATKAVADPWAPVLGSNVTAPPPPAPKTNPSASSSSGPEPTAAANTSNTSGALMGVGAPTALLTLAVAAFGAAFGASF